MAFSGKATYSAGASLPELHEDVSDVVGIVSPFETPLLDHLGDGQRAASSTVHEWLEDTLLPNQDAIEDAAIGDPLTDATFGVLNGDRFRIGDQITAADGREVMLITVVVGNQVGVVRGYGGTAPAPIATGQALRIIGNAALEGDEAAPARFTLRQRRQNYAQIFTATVEVSGSQLASKAIGVEDEMDYQKQERLRELLRDLENSVINGVAASVNPQGDAGTRRTMRGIDAHLTTNRFSPGIGPIPDGDGLVGTLLTEPVLNATLREVWLSSSGSVDTIVCGGFQKRRINSFIASNQRFIDHERQFSQMVEIYESDFGRCRVVMSRWVPPDTLLLLDSSRIDVMPLGGRSFSFKRLAAQGDAERGQVIGEYTMELRNENAHAVLTGLGMSDDGTSRVVPEREEPTRG